MSKKKSKKSVFVTWMKYIIGIPVSGFAPIFYTED